MKRRNLTLVLTATLAAIALLLLINGGHTGFAQSRTAIRLDTITLGPGEQGAITVQIECGAGQCGAFDLSIRFDPAIIQVDRIEIGPYLGPQPVVVENTFDNQAGSVDVAAAALGNPPQTADTVLLTLFVTARSTGSTPLHIQDVEVSDLIGNPQNVLPSDGTVMVAASGTRGELRVGISTGYAPFAYLDNAGNITGFDVAIITALAQQAGLEFRLVDTPWADIFSTLSAGQVDLIVSGMAITPEREEIVDFSNPYYYGSLRIVVQQARASAIQRIEDLTGLRIGVLKDSVGDAYASALLTDAQITRHDSAVMAFQALALGSVDALLFDGTLATALIEKNPGLGVVLTGPPLGEEYFGIAAQPGQSELLNTINIALREIIANGTYEQLFENWFNARPPEMFRKPAAAAVIPPTPLPTLTLTPPPTVTLAPSRPMITVQNSSVNLRSGPGVEYGVVGIVRRGERFVVIAQARGWWLILGPDDSPAWIAGWIVAIDPADAVVELAATIPPAPAAAPPASGGGAAPTAASGQVCSPGQWAGCGLYGCGTEYSARCNASGTGYECIWNPAGCAPSGDGGGGSPATKVPTPPKPPS